MKAPRLQGRAGDEHVDAEARRRLLRGAAVRRRQGRYGHPSPLQPLELGVQGLLMENDRRPVVCRISKLRSQLSGMCCMSRERTTPTTTLLESRMCNSRPMAWSCEMTVPKDAAM